jgi:uncharacterized protein (TIGR03000 family)
LQLISLKERRTMKRVFLCCAFLGLGSFVFLAFSNFAQAGSMRSGAARSVNRTPVFSYPRTPTAEEDYTYGDFQAANMVLINLRVPANAEVSFDGNKTSQSGGFRSFVTPALERGTEYSYEIRARWMNDGKPVEQTRKVNFRAGDRLTLDFRP